MLEKKLLMDSYHSVYSLFFVIMTVALTSLIDQTLRRVKKSDCCRTVSHLEFQQSNQNHQINGTTS